MKGNVATTSARKAKEPRRAPRPAANVLDLNAVVATTLGRSTTPSKPKAKKRHSIGVAMAGGNPLVARHADDFYATPEDVTLALLRYIEVEGPVWEPFCGDGAIAKVLSANGLDVVATDLVDRGYGDHGGGHDILSSDDLLAPCVVSNPPFKIAPLVIEHLMPMRPRMMALLLKSTFWNAAKRRALFNKHRPSHVLALSWRPDFAKKGCPTMECSWIVWTDGATTTQFDVLPRPEGFGNVRRRPRLVVSNPDPIPGAKVA